MVRCETRHSCFFARFLLTLRLRCPERRRAGTSKANLPPPPHVPSRRPCDAAIGTIHPISKIPTSSATKLFRFADILLPLAMPAPLTYRLPESLAATAATGCRAVVPLGPRKYYAGIIVRLHDEEPDNGIGLKDVADLIDTRPMLLPAQWELWQWIAQYYMCTPGEVMKAALPSGLKLESETTVALAETAGPDTALTAAESRLLETLAPGHPASIGDLQRRTGTAGVLRLVRSLLEKGAVSVCENLHRQFRPRTEAHVRLAEAFCNEESLNQIFGELAAARRQADLLTLYLDLADAAAALRLGNGRLLREVPKKTLMDRFGGSEAALAALRRRGVLEVYPYEVGRLRTQKADPSLSARQPSPPQEKAYREIRAALGTKDVCLLHGVTSSGKTEIYARLIGDTLRDGGQVLYLVPEIALTTQLTTRLGRIFGDRLGVYHSKFPDAERAELWMRQLSGTAFPMVLGARSALFLPFQRLRLIIIDEEHESSYKQQEPAPRYNARDAALVLARLCGAKVLLGTATPALETYFNARTGKYGLVELATRFGGVQLPEICVEDVKELKRKKLMRTPFSPRLTEEIRHALDEGGQAILFQNRRGYSPVLECRTCGWTPRCTRCDVSLTFHQRERKLVCHYCGTEYGLPRQCPNCGDTEMRDIGFGTEKIEAAVQACFPNARTARMDLDTTRSRTAYEKIIDSFQKGETNLLIGTQMVTKGLDFDRVRVVGILNADQMLSQPDFRACERAFQMMAQVAGRAGRRGKRGIVVLQTRQPHLPIVAQVAANDYRGMYESQAEERELFRFPPFCRLIDIYLKHRDEPTVDKAAAALAGWIRPHFGNDLLGPDKPAIGRIRLQHIRKIIVKVSPRLPAAGVRRTLLAARAALLAQAGFKSVNVYFDADPL